MGNTMFGIGRLKPGVTAAAAQADLQVISDRFKKTINYGGTLGATVTPLGDALRGPFRQAFAVLAGARALRPGDRVRQPVEPAAGAHQRAAAGVRGTGRARRTPPVT